MEGFLNKKGKGDSSFGRRNWKRRWFILEGSILTYYEDFDLQSGTPISQKGVNDVNGCEILPISQTEKKFGFVIKHSQRPPLFLQADDAKMMNTWIKALSAAAIATNKAIDYEECYARLGLNSAKNPNAGEINRSYRKAALKVHPDKGGDLAEFKKLQEAFETLMTKVELEEEAKNFRTITYQAVIKKGPQGVGLGMVVIEEAKKGNIKVKRVMPDMNLQSLTPEAEDEIRVGDILIGVGTEDVSKMPLSRVVQKISDFRIPVNTTVRLTFSRRLHLDGTPEEVTFDAPTVFTPNSGEENKATEEEEIKAGRGQTPLNSEPSGYNFNYSPPEDSGGPPQSPEKPANLPSHLDPVQYVAMMSENEELKNDLETSLHQLNQAYHDRDKLIEENRRARNEVSILKAQLAEAAQRQKLLELQLEQSCIYGVISPDQLAQSLNDMLTISAKVQSDQPIEVSPELNSYMTSLGLPSDNNDQIKAAQRNAISASASIDKTGVMLQKWNLAGDSVLDKLSRFEETIQRLEATRPEAPPPKIEKKLSSTFDEAASFSSFSVKSSILSPAKAPVPTSASAAAASYKGLAGGTSAVRSPLPRAQSEYVRSSSPQLSKTGTPLVEARVSKPLVFPKRQGPPQAPMARTMSSMQ